MPTQEEIDLARALRDADEFSMPGSNLKVLAAAYRTEKERADKQELMTQEGRTLARNSYDEACKQKARSELLERQYAELLEYVNKDQPDGRRALLARHEDELLALGKE
jgi:hypothetical protein